MISLAGLPRAILHVDCDAFFASVEQALRPELKGRPVAVGAERGIAVSLSYEAKARGVRRGMMAHEIKKLCPDCIFVSHDFEAYGLFSERVFEILRRFTPEVEEASIDEAYADLTGLRRLHHASYEDISLQIKDTVERELGITISAGLSLTKTLAKIGSKHRKPSGFVCIKGYDLESFLKDIPAERVCGFGPNTTALLAKHGILTVLDYIRRDEEFARKVLGKIGVDLWHELRGEAVYPVLKGPQKDPLSLSRARTFTPPTGAEETVRAELMQNVESTFAKLRRLGLHAKTIGIFLKTSSFQPHSAVMRFPRPVQATADAVPAAVKLFKQLFDPEQKYRQTGVFLSGLKAVREIQYDLFDPAAWTSAGALSGCLDKINERFGRRTVRLGSTQVLFGKEGVVLRKNLRVPVWDVRI